MKIKVEALMEAVVVLTIIINSNRPMSQKGKYRIARMHSKLNPEFMIVDKQRNDMIKAYDHKQMSKAQDKDGNDVMIDTGNYQVPPDKLEEFNTAWKEIVDQEIEVDVSPIPLAMIDMGDDKDGSISAAELVALGDLVSE